MEQHDGNSQLQRRRQNGHVGVRAHQRGSNGFEDEARVDFAEIWAALYDGKWIILLTCLLVTGAAIGYTFTVDPVYESSSIVAIESQSEAPARFAMMGETRNLESEIGVLETSDELVAQVVGRLRSRADSADAEHKFPLLFDDDGNFIGERNAGQKVLAAASFTPMTSRQMIRITIQSTEPEAAAAIANVYADEYREYSREKSRASIVAARKFLEEQAAKQKKEIRNLEEQWETFARNNEVIAQGEEGSGIVKQYSELQARRNELQFQREQEQRLLETLQQQVNELRPQVEDQVMREQETTEIQTQIDAMNKQLADLRATAEPYYINNPDLRERSVSELQQQGYSELAQIKEKIAGFEKRQTELVQQLVRQASGDGQVGQEGALAHVADLNNRITQQEHKIAQIEAQISALNEKITSYETKIDNIPGQQIEQTRLEEQLTQAKAFYKQILSQLQEVVLKEESELGYVKPVRTAYVPGAPVRPDLRQNILLGLLLGLGLGIGAAFLRRSLSSQLRSPEDLQEKGYSLAGVVPAMDEEVSAAFDGQEVVELDGRYVSTRLMPLLKPWSPIAENYRLIRSNLQYANPSSAPQVILVTSPEPGEGKTVSAANLAIAMAQSGRRTILLDADLRRPNMHKILDLDRTPGLAEILTADEESLVTLGVTSGIDNLDVLPAGNPIAPPAEILESDRMKTLMAELRERYDVVVIDSPPVMAVTDPVHLAQQADATLLVASADNTSHQALELAKQTLQAVGVEVSGVIFNKFRGRPGSYDYGYRYRDDYSYM